mmetsp:Transcript_29424/g.67114  ORF Transcript_29424/g.67114 Transcript_29424/m.67114 type:complete len:105 (+) Transcript_29424:176-490(+)
MNSARYLSVHCLGKEKEALQFNKATLPPAAPRARRAAAYLRPLRPKANPTARPRADAPRVRPHMALHPPSGDNISKPLFLLLTGTPSLLLSTPILAFTMSLYGL